MTDNPNQSDSQLDEIDRIIALEDPSIQSENPTNSNNSDFSLTDEDYLDDSDPDSVHIIDLFIKGKTSGDLPLLIDYSLNFSKIMMILSSVIVFISVFMNKQDYFAAIGYTILTIFLTGIIFWIINWYLSHFLLRKMLNARKSYEENSINNDSNIDAGTIVDKAF